MPLSIVRDDITRIECDAIVNPTNEKLIPGGGVDMRIHSVAGEDLQDMCNQLGGLKLGQAKITPAYDLPCKFVIHTVGPHWKGGKQGEETHLRSCYEEALKIAKATKCTSIAFPLISSGTYGYPKDKVLNIALEILKSFLNDYDMMIYLVVYDKTSYALSRKLQDGIESFIYKHYEGDEDLDFDDYDNYGNCITNELMSFKERTRIYAPASIQAHPKYLKTEDDESCLPFEDLMSVGTLPDHLLPNFRETLFGYIDQKGINDVDCYKNANVSRQTWSKIVNDKNYIPKKTTIIALAISLKLNIEETQNLLSTMGFVLSKAILFDVIIMYCIKKKIYDVFEIDSILFKYDQRTLFSAE